MQISRISNQLDRVSLLGGLGSLGLTFLYAGTRHELLLPVTTVACAASLLIAAVAFIVASVTRGGAAGRSIAGGVLSAFCLLGGIPFG